MRIELDDLSRTAVLSLLEEHLRDRYELSPPDKVFAFDASIDVARARCRGPFGTYRENGYSVFMSLRLA